MSTYSSEVDQVLRRVERLEREARWFKNAGLAAMVTAGAILVMGGQGSSTPKALSGERFSLKDSSGKERAYFAVGENGPGLHFVDVNGEARAGLDMGREGLTLRVLDGRGNLQTGISLEQLGIAVVSHDKAGSPLVGSNALKNDGGLLTLERRR